jgi:hypothetical protein
MSDYLDAPIELETAQVNLRTSADAMRALIKATGHTMTELLQDDENEADRMQAIAFLELHRRAARAGHPLDPGDLWERAGRVEIAISGEAPNPYADPLNDGSSTTSPRSVVSGE